MGLEILHLTALQLRARSAATLGVSWANLCALAIGAAVAVVGGVLNEPGLLALGSSIVGGVLGNAMPGRPGAHGAAAPLVGAAPTIGRARARRRRATPGAFGIEATLRNRLPGIGTGPRE
jgi:hypothetical protein